MINVPAIEASLPWVLSGKFQLRRLHLAANSESLRTVERDNKTKAVLERKMRLGRGHQLQDRAEEQEYWQKWGVGKGGVRCSMDALISLQGQPYFLQRIPPCNSEQPGQSLLVRT